MAPVSTSPTCLIVEPLPLVARDLAMTLGEALQVSTLVAPSEVEAVSAVAALPAETPLPLAILRIAPEAFAVSPLRAAVEQRGARVVLMGGNLTEPAPDAPWPWAVLDWPFGTDQLLALLAGLGLRPGPAAA